LIQLNVALTKKIIIAKDQSLPEAASDPPAASPSLFELAKLQNFSMAESLLLIDSEADKVLESKDEESHTLLHWASLVGNHSFVSKLLEVAAQRKGSHWMKTEFLEHRAEKTSQTALMWAFINGSIPTIHVFKRLGADFNAVDSLGANCGILAVQHNQLEALLLLYSWNPQILLKPDNSGCTVSHWAAYKGNCQALRLLRLLNPEEEVTEGSKCVDNLGMTPLHRACSIGAIESIRFLVYDCKMSPLEVTFDGRTAIDICNNAKNIHPRAATYLNEFKTRQTKQEVLKLIQSKLDFERITRFAIPAIYWFAVFIWMTTYWMGTGTFERSFVNIQTSLFNLFALSGFSLYAYLMLGNPGFKAKQPKNPKILNDLILDIQKQTGTGNPDPSLSPSLDRFCLTCCDYRDLRTKHCSVCGKCCPNFDHHCGWVNNCIGKKNHRFFVLMLLVNLIAEILHIQIIYSFIKNGDKSENSLNFLYKIARTVFDQQWVFASMTLHVLFFPFVVIMLFSQLRIVAYNLNTNEQINLHRYTHFWKLQQEGELGDSYKFVNPFDRGVWRNCVNFWTGQEIIGDGKHYGPSLRDLRMWFRSSSAWRRGCGKKGCGGEDGSSCYKENLKTN
jgi:ankyrin repeat protein